VEQYQSKLPTKRSNTTMANLFNWVEIPASDFDRAQKFYRTILGIEQELYQPPNMGDMRYGILPMEGEGAGGAIVQHENYAPGQGQGVCVYLVVQGDLNATLAKVESAGGKVVIGKMSLGDMGPGYIAQFIDSEGNRVGLFSLE
jgi:predicted enzyme related to lactoylglutathione lyase